MLDVRVSATSLIYLYFLFDTTGHWPILTHNLILFDLQVLRGWTVLYLDRKNHILRCISVTSG